MKVGATREALAEAVEALLGPEFYVDPSDLYRNYNGPYNYEDCASWHGYSRLRTTGTVVHSFYSYDTMKICARYGVEKIGAGSQWDGELSRKG